jgi:hypothetical protein
VTVYAVYEPPKETPELARRAEQLAFVKEGFSWPALFVPLFWLLYHRMWITFVILLLIYVALPFLFGTSGQGEMLATWASLAVNVLFAFEANDLRAASLERRGHRLAGIAIGSGRVDAERSFFSAWLPRENERARSQPRGHEARREGETAPVPRARGEGEEVIGLFPQA